MEDYQLFKEFRSSVYDTVPEEYASFCEIAVRENKRNRTGAQLAAALTEMIERQEKP